MGSQGGTGPGSSTAPLPQTPHPGPAAAAPRSPFPSPERREGVHRAWGSSGVAQAKGLRNELSSPSRPCSGHQPPPPRGTWQGGCPGGGGGGPRRLRPVSSLWCLGGPGEAGRPPAPTRKGEAPASLAAQSEKLKERRGAVRTKPAGRCQVGYLWNSSIRGWEGECIYDSKCLS